MMSVSTVLETSRYPTLGRAMNNFLLLVLILNACFTFVSFFMVKWEKAGKFATHLNTR